ncbi:glycosyltransferase, partial [Kineococcus gynurae]|uniref:glycosyltransferase n=1 Tax=Kineococcus gynurae TaxID=452979 RepID=UPI003D7EF070
MTALHDDVRPSPRRPEPVTPPPCPPRTLRVLIGADTYSPDVNGASRFTQRLADELAARHDVHVVVPARTLRNSTQQVGGVVEHRIRAVPVLAGGTGLRVCPPAGLTARCRDVLRAVAPDVVHVQSHFLLGRALVRAADQLGVPVVATNHFMPENLTHHVPLGRRVQARLHDWAWSDAAAVLRRAAVVTAPTPFAAELTGRAGVPGPVLPVSCGLDLDRFAPDPTGRRGAAFRRRFGIGPGPVLGFVGRLAPEKNVADVVRALAELHRRRPALDAHLLLVGDGALRPELGRLAADLGVAGAITFTGFVAEDDLPDAYRACDVFVNAGTAELQSLVVLEAMACGRPVLGVRAGALPHLVRDGENGYLFPPGDPAALAARAAPGVAAPPPPPPPPPRRRARAAPP